MSWSIRYDPEAEQELDCIFAYIRDVLVEPEIAKKQVARIASAADDLDHFPLRHRLCDFEPWRSRGVRTLPVDNFLIFYHPDETTHIVTIFRIIYGARDLADLYGTDRKEAGRL